MKAKAPKKLIKERVDELYASYHRREYVHPDPLEFLYDYDDLKDREIVGLIASSLAYGRVAQILKSVSIVIKPMGHSPFSFLMGSSKKSLFSTFSNFKHRFTTGDQLALMLWGARKAIMSNGSLYNSFRKFMGNDDRTVITALSKFVNMMYSNHSPCRHFLVPSPDKGSACKRLNLFLRWMVREDKVDPGGWKNIPKSKLVVPLDTHMHRIGILLNMTSRKQADLKAALEMTRAFKNISPEDPVRYDFCLTRLGIRDDLDLNYLIC